MTKRLDTTVRTEQLLAAALAEAQRCGWRQMTREGIASAAGVSPGLVSARLGTMDALRRSVMRQAIKQRVLRIVAEGLVARDRHALAADEALRRAAMEAACL